MILAQVHEVRVDDPILRQIGELSIQEVRYLLDVLQGEAEISTEVDEANLLVVVTSSVPHHLDGQRLIGQWPQPQETYRYTFRGSPYIGEPTDDIEALIASIKEAAAV